MGIVGTLPLTNENNNQTISFITHDNHTEVSHQEISNPYLCMKQLQTVAAKLDKQYYLEDRKHKNEKLIKHDFRCEKHRQIGKKLKYKNENNQHKLKEQIQQLELQQTRLFSIVNKLHLYKQELETVCHQINSSDESME